MNGRSVFHSLWERYGLLVWGRFSWVRLFPNGADIALHPACTFVFRSVHQHGWGLSQGLTAQRPAPTQSPCVLAPGRPPPDAWSRIPLAPSSLLHLRVQGVNRFAFTSIHTTVQRLLACSGSCTLARSKQSLVSMSTAAELMHRLYQKRGFSA